MAEKKISALTAVATPARADVLPVDQGGTVTKKMSVAQLLSLVLSTDMSDFAAAVAAIIAAANLATDAEVAAAIAALGTMSAQNANNVTITGGSISGIVDLAIADGGTGASSASAARNNLGLGTAAVADTGASSGNVPVLDGSGKLPLALAPAEVKTASVAFVIDGGGAAVTTGVKGDLVIPFACTIQSVTLLADQSGSIVLDIWKDSYANYPPVDADSITASAPPTISAATKSQDTSLVGWTTSVAAGDVLRFNVDSAATLTRVVVALKVVKS